MPTMREFLRPKPKIDEAEWAEAQARTVKRLQDFFAPADDTAEADSPPVAEAFDVVASAAAVATDITASNGRVRPPILYAGGSDLDSGELTDASFEPTAPSDTPAATLDEEDASGAALVGVMAPVVDDLGWDLSRSAPDGADEPEDASDDGGVAAVEMDSVVAFEPEALLEPEPMLEPEALLEPEAADDFTQAVPVMAGLADGLADDPWRLPDVATSSSSEDSEMADPPVADAVLEEGILSPEPELVLAGVAGSLETAAAAPEVTGSAVEPDPDMPDAISAPGPEASEIAAVVITPARPARVRAKPAARRPSTRSAATTEHPVAAIAAPVAPTPTPARTAAPKPKPVRTAAPKRVAAPRVSSAAPITAHCPYCAKLLDPAPTTNRRCERCRHRIVVRRINGAVVYLTEAALDVFESERVRRSNTARWTRERERWLRLAATVDASETRRAQLAKTRLSEEVVAACRALFLNASDRAFRAARTERDWVTASRLRREKAMALYRAADAPMPPPADLVAIHREGVAAELRGLSEIAREAQLVSAKCCDICQAESGVIVRISAESREPRLPHAGCERGLCACRWDLAERDRLNVRQYLRRRP